MSGSLDRQVAEIGAMDLEQLRAGWRRRYGAPPPLRSVPILRQLLAWRVQIDTLGGLDAEARRALRRTGPAQQAGRNIGVGAKLTRSWQGRTVEMVVTEDGFRWEGRTFKILSAAATAIAGTKWNGPRFFGLREAA